MNNGRLMIGIKNFNNVMNERKSVDHVNSLALMGTIWKSSSLLTVVPAVLVLVKE